MGLKESGLRGSLRNVSVGIDAIPDGAVLHYPFLERSDSTILEQIEGEDGTANGTTNVFGNWREGYAEDGDGSNDYTLLTTWPQFLSTFFNDWTIFVTVNTTDGSGIICGSFGSPNVQLNFGSPGAGDFSTGEIEFLVTDGDGNNISIGTDDTYNDGEKHRLAFRKSGNSASDLSIFVDAVEVDTSVGRDQSFADTGETEFSQPFSTHADYNDDSPRRHLAGVVDNLIPCQGSLSASDIQSDYDAQPWS